MFSLPFAERMWWFTEQKAMLPTGLRIFATVKDQRDF
jgi:hypothetical protein